MTRVRSRDALGREVHAKQEEEVDHRVEQPDRRRHAEVGVQQAGLVDVGRDDLRLGQVQRVLQQEGLLEPDRHDVADAEHQDDHRGRHDPGQVDVPDPLQPAGPVDPGRLVQRRVDAGQRGQVDDRRVPGGLPHVRPDVDVAEVVRVAEEVDRGYAEQADRVVDEPQPRRQHQDRHRDDHHGGDEVRRVGDQLGDLLEPAVADLVQRDGQHDRDREAGQHGVGGQEERVLHQGPEHRVLEEQFEVAEPDPVTAPRALDGAVVLEGDHRVGDRDVLEDDEVRERYDDQQVELPVPAQAAAGRGPAAGPGDVPGGFHRLPGCRCRRRRFDLEGCAHSASFPSRAGVEPISDRISGFATPEDDTEPPAAEDSPAPSIPDGDRSAQIPSVQGISRIAMGNQASENAE